MSKTAATKEKDSEEEMADDLDRMYHELHRLQNIRIDQQERIQKSLEAYNRECKRVDELTEDLEREKVKVQQYKDMVDPIIEWGQSKESGMPLGVSITKETLRRAKKYAELEGLLKEIDAWLSFNAQPSAEQLQALRTSIKKSLNL